MTHYLVTGGAGFIGSHLVRAILSRGDEVSVIDDLSTGSERNLADVADRIRFVRASVNDRDALSTAMTGVDHVLHQAALGSVPRSVADPMATHHANAEGTLAVFEAARAAGVKRVVYASSSSVYGKNPTLPKEESLPLSPLSPYAASKLSGEAYGRAYHASYGLETVGLRYFNVFGPRQDPNSQYAAVLPRFITCALTGKRPVIFGDGHQSRDFSYVQNSIEANLLACTAKAAPGGVYNIACQGRTSLLQVIGLLEDMCGVKLDPIFEPPRTGDVKHSEAAIALAREELGYTAPVDFADGLERTVAWYREQLPDA